MASTQDYHCLEPSLIPTHCQNSLSTKNNANLSPMDLDFSSAMNLNTSNDIVQADQQWNQQQQLAISPVSRNSSFRLPSFASLISFNRSHSVPRNDHLTSSTVHPYSNPTQTSLHLPRLDHLANRSSLITIHSSTSMMSSEYSVQQQQQQYQPGFGHTYSPTTTPTRPSDASAFVPVTCDNNRASFVNQHTSDSILNTTPTDTSKKGRRRKPKFISRVLNANMKWSTSSTKNNDMTTFQTYKHEHRRLSQHEQQGEQQQQQMEQFQQQQKGRRRRTSSVGTTHSLASSPTTTTMVKPRWQETERLELLKAVIKEKQLDDMTTFNWDRISLAVGRGRKSAKDQWRREILPALLKKLK